MKRKLETDANDQAEEPPAKKQKMNNIAIESSKIFTNYEYSDYDQHDFQDIFKSIENSSVVDILPREIRQEIAEYATGAWEKCRHCDQNIGILYSQLMTGKYEGICVSADVEDQCWIICMECAENLAPNNCECGATIYIPNYQRCTVCNKRFNICEEQMDHEGWGCGFSEFSYCKSCREFVCLVCAENTDPQSWETCCQHHEYFMGEPNESDDHLKLKCDDCNIDIKCDCFSDWKKRAEWDTELKDIGELYHGFVACEFADCLNFVCNKDKHHGLIRCPKCKTEFRLCASHTSILWKCEKCND